MTRPRKSPPRKSAPGSAAGDGRTPGYGDPTTRDLILLAMPANIHCARSIQEVAAELMILPGIVRDLFREAVAAGHMRQFTPPGWRDHHLLTEAGVRARRAARRRLTRRTGR